MKFIVESSEVNVKVLTGETLLELAIRSKLPIQHSCGGMGTCGTCRVIVREGLNKMPPPGVVEMEMISDRGFTEDERLACQNDAQGGLTIEIPTPQI